MNNEPIIRPVPTEREFRQMVDELIPVEPGINDGAAKAFVNMILTVANPEDDAQWHLANVAARHAFAKTEAAEMAFRKFSGWPDRQIYDGGMGIISIRSGKEM